MKKIAYRKHLDEVLHFTVFRVYAGDNAFKIGQAFHQFSKLLLECLMVNQFLNSVESAKRRTLRMAKPNETA